MKALPYAVTIVFSFALFAASVPQALADTGASYHIVSGTVRSDQGEPLPGVQVRGWSTWSDETRSSLQDSDFTTTDAEGRYSLKLPAGKGAISVYYEKWRQGASKDILVEGNATGIDLVLQTPPPKTAIVTGRILDESGNPLSGAVVRLDYACCYAMANSYAEPAAEPVSDDGADAKMAPAIAPMPPCCYDYVEPVTTGDDGVYRFETYAGPRQVVAYAKGYAQSMAQVDARENQTATKDLKLEKVPDANAVVKGRIVDAETGLPVRGASVSVNNVEWSRYGYAEVKDDGSFEITTLPGWTQVSVHVYNHGYGGEKILLEADASSPLPGASGPGYYAWTRTLDLREGANDVAVKLDRKPAPTLVLIGYVLDPETKTGIPRATVSVWNQDTGDWGTATTDATGSYKLLVRAGHYTANTWAEGYLSTAETFVLRDGEATKRMDFQMPKGEPKYAPCHDESCGGIYATRSTMAEPMPAPTMAPAGGSSMGSTAEADGSTGGGANEMATTKSAITESDASSTRAASYQGSGGGLPPYSEADAQGAGTGQAAAAGANTVPGFGLVAALGLVALAALALRRR